MRVQTKTSYESIGPSRARRVETPIVTKLGHTPADHRKHSEPAHAFDSRALWKRGHQLSYIGLFIFTLVLYARPSDFSLSPIIASLALIIGLLTLAVFVPTQLLLENNLTARSQETTFLLLFALAALLSIPFAFDPRTAWGEFSGTFIRCVAMFVVMVNVTRTKARLHGLILLALASGVWLSLAAINDYRLGLMTVEGFRAAGRGNGMFGNSDDMALHLVTLLPIPIALFFGSRGILRRLLYGPCAILMLAGIVLSYSRGAFLGMMVVLGFCVLRLGRRNRAGIAAAVILLLIGLLVLAPGGYGSRLLSIFDHGLDVSGSATARRSELIRSIWVALRHPLLGIGIGNYAPQMSLGGIVTHNSYTQVAAELGLPALTLYVMFIVTPLRKLRQMVRETFNRPEYSDFHYMSVGLQGALIGYMVTSFFLSVPFRWYVYYLVAYAVCLRRLYESETGKLVVVEKRAARHVQAAKPALVTCNEGVAK